MSTEEKKSIIASLPIFHGLSSQELDLLTQITNEKVLAPHSIFIKQDDTSRDVYFILSGNVRVYKLTEEGKEVHLALLSSGDIVGEMALIDNEPRSANVETIQETQLLFIRGSDFDNLLLHHPEMNIHLLRILSKRIREIDTNTERISTKTLPERTLDTLNILAHHFKNRKITLSQEELSLIIGATRARVTEALQILQNEGKVKVEHRKIHVM